MELVTLFAACLAALGALMQMYTGLLEIRLTESEALAHWRAESQLSDELHRRQRRQQKREFRKDRPPKLAAQIRLLECKLIAWSVVCGAVAVSVYVAALNAFM